MKIYVDESGNYLGGWDQNPPDGAIEVPTAPYDAKEIWDFDLDKWLPIQLTDDEMLASEISQDKQYLADTDYIVTKIGESALLGNDTKPLLEQYAEQIERRELARVRIRIAEGRA